MSLNVFQQWFALWVIFFSVSAAANEITVFDVRKNFPMKNGEKVYRDYYINAGAESGIKQGMIINVTRRRALYDAYQNRSLGNLVVPVGKLKVIHVQQGVAVARLYSSFSRSSIPGLEYDFILVGDQVDMASAYFEKKQRRKRAAQSLEPDRTVALAGAADSETIRRQTERATLSPTEIKIPEAH